jgi:hypothetical protein
MRMRGALVGGALTAALLACTTGTATAASDPGWFDGKSTEERQAIVNYVYERTGHAPPYTGGAAEDLSAEMAQSMIDAGEDDAPLAPDGGALELVVGTRVGLMTRLTTIMPSIPLAAGVGTFAAGYAIGTGVRKLFATITAPDDAGPAGSSLNSTWITWYPAGYEIFFGARVQQSPGAYLYNDGGGVARWWEPPCEYSGLTPPAGARLQYGVPSTAECNVYIRDVGNRLFPVYVNYPYLLESDVHPTAPLRPFNPATDYAWEWEPYPPDPGPTAVEDDLDVLDEDGNDLLRDQLDWVATPGSQPEEEPVRVGTRLSEEDRACKDHFDDAPQSDPGRRSPEADPEAAEWDYDVDEFSDVYNPLIPGTQDVTLRWGTRSWGYRHVVLRHGWDAAAAARTALALADPSPTLDLDHDSTRRSFQYVYDIPGLPNGMRCQQLTVVSYRSNATFTDGRHIITSFVREAQ